MHPIASSSPHHPTNSALQGSKSPLDLHPRHHGVDRAGSVDAQTQRTDSSREQNPHARVESSPQVAQAFRQRIMQTLKAHFGEAFSSAGKHHALHTYRDTSTAQGANNPADTITTELMDAAKIAATQTSTPVKTVLSRMEHALTQATNELQKLVNGDTEVDTLKQLNNLLADKMHSLENKVSANASSVNAFAVQASLKQSSSIEIRTREGDIVTLDLRKLESMNLSSMSANRGNTSFSNQSVALSTDSSLMFTVQGDLNDAEMEAIAEVFAQAEKLAKEFFSGDMAAAMQIATHLQIDGDQLSQVDMDFRSDLQVNTQQSQLRSDFAHNRANSQINDQQARPGLDYLAQMLDFLKPVTDLITAAPTSQEAHAAEPIADLRFDIDAALRLDILQSVLETLSSDSTL